MTAGLRSLILSALVALAAYELFAVTGALSGLLLLVLPYALGVRLATLVTHNRRHAAIGALVPLAVLGPQAVPASELTQILILGVVALGLNVVTGWAGQIHLAQGVFVGFGAYTTALLTTRLGWPLLATIPVAGAVAGVFGLLLGLVALRFTGVFLAVLTTSLALVTPIVLKHYGSVTGGAGGILVEPLTPGGAFDALGVDQLTYIVTVVVATLAAVLTWNMLAGRVGRALRAVRDSPVAAMGIGVQPTRYKALAFTVSSFWAGIAGALYAITIGFINPDSFGLFYGVQFLTMIVVGGISTIGGSFIGAAIVYELTTHVQDVGLPGSIAGQSLSLPQQAIFGIILIVVILLVPRGITGVLYASPAAVLHRLRGAFRTVSGNRNRPARSEKMLLTEETR